MRNESYWTRQLMAHLKENRRKWLCYKLADHFTAGVPDVTIIGCGCTTWIELKVLKPTQSLRDRVMQDPLQYHDMHKIEQNGNPAWYAICMPGDDLNYVTVRPSYFAGELEKSPVIYTSWNQLITLVETKYEN